MEVFITLLIIVAVIVALRVRKRRRSPIRTYPSVQRTSNQRSGVPAPPPAKMAPAAKSKPSGSPSPRPTTRLASNGRVTVVGEGHYQPALRAAASGRATRAADFDDAIRVQAVLVPEPTNPYDSHAVSVDVAGKTVGYLSREVAKSYQSALLKIGAGAWCPGRIMGGGDRNYGIHLHLGDPDHLVVANSASGFELLDTGRSVAVTREEDHQDVLERYPDGAVVAVNLLPAVVGKGKYKGERCVEVRLDGDRVGELTFKSSEQYLSTLDAMVAAGKAPGCEAVISNDHRGRQIDVQLPKR